MSKRKVNFMTFTKLTLALACIVSGPLLAQEAKVKPQAKVTELLSKDLTNLPGKEGLTRCQRHFLSAPHLHHD